VSAQQYEAPAVPLNIPAGLADPGSPPVVVQNPTTGEPQYVEEEIFFDSFTPDERFRFFLPDGKQFIEFKQMTEGDKLSYERQTNRDLRVDQKQGLAHFKVDQGGDRHRLIELVVTGWYLKIRSKNGKGFENYAFTPANLRTWLDQANPKVIADLHSEIIRRNPGVLGSDMEEEDILKEIEDLQEQLVELRKEKAGKA
jgi:hypothetical protein